MFLWPFEEKMDEEMPANNDYYQLVTVVTVVLSELVVGLRRREKRFKTK